MATLRHRKRYNRTQAVEQLTAVDPAKANVERNLAIWLLLAFLALAVLILALALLGTRALALRRHLSAGAQQLHAAQTLLASATAGGQAFQISTADLDQAQSELAQAQANLAIARSDLQYFSLPLMLVRRLPWLGGTAAAVPPTLHFAISAAQGAQELVQGLRPLARERELPDSNEPAAQRYTEALIAGEPNFQAAQRDLDQAQAARQRIHEGAVLPVLRGPLAPLTQWDRQWPAVNADLNLLVQLPPVLQAVLGFQSPRTYAILGQNSAELRPTGGFLGSMGIVHISRGQITQQDYRSIYDYDPDLSGTKRPLPAAPQPIADHLGIAGWHIEDANWSPDFPTSARDIRDFLAYDTGAKVDGVIAFDSYAVQDLLRALGPVSVTVNGQTQQFTADDWLRLTTQLIYLDPQNAKAADAKQIVLAPLLQAVITRMNSTSGGQLTSVVQALRSAIAGRHILFQFDDAAAAQFVASYHADGSLALTEGETTLYPVEANLSYTKIGPFIKQNAVYELWFNADGVCTAARLRLTWENTVTQAQIADPVNRIGGKEWSMAQGKLIDMPGVYGFSERIYAPGGTQFITSGGLQGDLTQSSDGAFTVFSTYLSIPAGQSHELTLDLALPNRETDPGHFVLNLPNQPGTLDRGLSVIIHAAGDKPQSNVPLQAMGTATYQYTGLLNQPQRLDLRFGP